MKKTLTITSLFFFLIILIFLIKDYKSDIPVETLKAKYTNSLSKFMSIDGMQVHYRDEGILSDSIPLVLIHGTSSSLHTWDACTEEWKKHHRVIRFDLPAFGLTGPNATNNYSLNSYVDFVNKVLEKLNITKCVVAGNSLGGGIAWEYAYTYPHKVDKLILLDAIGYKFKTGKGGVGFKVTATLGKIPLIKNTLYYITPYAIVKKSVEGVYYDKSKVKQSTIDRYMDFTLREGNRKALVARLSIPMPDESQRIKTIKTPTLIIWGEFDELIPIACAYKFKKDIPGSELKIIKNSGHIPMEESPEQVIPIVEQFISTR